jgi:hypothetical protein
MTYKNVPLDALSINRANDRHGELENETAAIAWLFNNRQQHMLNLAKDIVEKGEIYEPPLVWPDNDTYTVYDGNRRVTCLKLLDSAKRAPNQELRAQFEALREKWKGAFPDKVLCQVETDRDRIDEILFRRHTGSQSGVGQSTWDDRMKANFVSRTGMGTPFNVADEIERRLRAATLQPARRIPRSTMNRLLSSEAFRNRLGFSVNKGRFAFTHSEPVVLTALGRVASDLASKKVVLGDIWDVDGKRKYIDSLEHEGLLPTAAHTLQKPKVPGPGPNPGPSPPKPQLPSPQPRRTALIPQATFPLPWPGRLQRLRAIWEELQFRLDLTEHPNAISVLFRVLLELSIDNYVNQERLTTVKAGDTLARKAVRVGEDLHAKGKITQKYLDVIGKLPQFDVLFSINTLNMYVHSPQFAPSPDHLVAMWDTSADLIVHCLSV